MLRHTLIAGLLTGLSLLPTSRGDEPSTWQPGALVGGLPYHKAEELRSFYKLSTGVKNFRKGAYAIGNTDVSIELGPGARELSIGGIQIELSRPLHRDAAGAWLISREDWVANIDPILRPTYIPGREAVHTIVLDAGHGGHDKGEESAPASEAVLTLQIAHKLKAELEKAGYKVILTRSEDMFLSDQQRVEIANAAGAGSIFLSLHLNSGRSDFRGVSVYTLAPGEDARPGHAHQQAHAALAYALQSALLARTGAVDKGCKKAHYSLLSSITSPAAWVELGYATHAQEGASLANPAYQETLVQALAQGIATYAHVADPATKIPVQTPPPHVPVKQNVATPTKGASTDTARTATPPRQQRNTSSRKPPRQQSAGKPQNNGGRRQNSSGKNRR